MTARLSSPLQYNPSTWDVLVHSRDAATWKQLEPMDAHHGPQLRWLTGHPPDLELSSQAVFQCNDHVMTSIQADGYGLIVLTPNQLVDFSSGEAVVRFDMSTFRSSPRDWVSVWLSAVGRPHSRCRSQEWLSRP